MYTDINIFNSGGLRPIPTVQYLALLNNRLEKAFIKTHRELPIPLSLGAWESGGSCLLPPFSGALPGGCLILGPPPPSLSTVTRRIFFVLFGFWHRLFEFSQIYQIRHSIPGTFKKDPVDRICLCNVTETSSRVGAGLTFVDRVPGIISFRAGAPLVFVALVHKWVNK